LKDKDSSGVLVSLFFPLFQPQLLTVKKLNAFVLDDCQQYKWYKDKHSE
jgi:hypothetical protein